MDSSIIGSSLLILVLLIISGFFSGSESAFFSIDKVTLSRLKKKKTRNSRLVVKLLNNNKKLLTIILVGNSIVNIFYASFVAIIAHRVIKSFGLNEVLSFFLVLLVETFFLLILGEITPKIFAVHNNEKFSEFSAPIIMFIYYLIFPVWKVFYHISKVADFFFHKKDSASEKLTEEDVKTLVKAGANDGLFKDVENKMISGILKFPETITKEIMVSRLDMIAFNINDEFEDLIELIKSHGFSRIPIYNDKIDNIMGVLYVKDLLLAMKLKKIKREEFREIIRTPYFVPGSKPINELMKGLQEKKIHMAIVVDEHGGVLGLVTLEDVLEEIVGEIWDEYDQKEDLIREIDKNIYMVDSKINIDELNEVLNINIETDDANTLGGFIYEYFGRIPKVGEKFSYKNMRFDIKIAIRNRIKKVLINLNQRTNTEENVNNA